MENEKRIKIYPDMKQDRLQKLISKEDRDLEQLSRLGNHVVKSLLHNAEGWLYNKRLNTANISVEVIDDIKAGGRRLTENQLVKRYVEEIFGELIKLNPRQSELLQFVLSQDIKQADHNRKQLIAKHGLTDTYQHIIDTTKSQEMIFRTGIQYIIGLKFENVKNLKIKNLKELRAKLVEIKQQQIKEQQQMFSIAPDITIQKLSGYNSSGNYYCLEYNTDNKNLFFDEIKNGNLLKRIKIEGVSLNNESEFHEYTQKFIKKLDDAYFLSPVYHTFFNKEHIKQVLLKKQLVNKPDDVIIDINKNFGDRNIGFAAIKTAEGNKSFDKIMFFQAVDGTDGNSYLHVVECGELLSENRRTMFENNEIESLLEGLNYDLYNSVLNYTESKKPIIDIMKSGGIFKPAETKIGTDGSEIKPYDKYLKIDGKLFSINTQVQNPDDNIVKEHIKKFINTRNITQNANLMGANCELTNELIDKSLGINEQQ